MIRKLEQKDKEAFLKMEHEFYHSPAVLHAIPEKHFESTFAHIMSGSPFAECWIFQEEESIAGYALLALTYSNEAGGLCVWIEEIYVRDHFKGNGIGSAFFRFLKQKYPQAKRLRLEIEEDNLRAKKLYEKMGFKPLDYRQMIIDS